MISSTDTYGATHQFALQNLLEAMINKLRCSSRREAADDISNQKPNRYSHQIKGCEADFRTETLESDTG